MSTPSQHTYVAEVSGRTTAMVTVRPARGEQKGFRQAVESSGRRVRSARAAKPISFLSSRFLPPPVRTYYGLAEPFHAARAWCRQAAQCQGRSWCTWVCGRSTAQSRTSASDTRGSTPFNLVVPMRVAGSGSAAASASPVTGRVGRTRPGSEVASRRQSGLRHHGDEPTRYLAQAKPLLVVKGE